MKALIFATFSVLGLVNAAHAEAVVQQDQGPGYIQVDRIPALGRIHGWKAVDKDTLIVWATAFQPYLVELMQPSHDLKFVETIGVSEFAGSIHSKFDSVYVRGMKYRIDEIYKLTPEEAEAL